MDYRSVKYDVVDMGRIATFSRVGKTTGTIQFNKRFFSKLTPDEKLTQVIWCCEKRKDHSKPDQDVDIEVYAICKELNLLKPLLSGMIKQAKVTNKSPYTARVKNMELMIENE